MLRVCSEFGCTEISTSDESRWCEDHTKWSNSSRRRPRTKKESGYDEEWRRVSKRARRAQPFCSDCGTTEHLTADHLPIAWERKERGLPIRLQDVDVVCGICNTARGSSRPDAPPREESPAERRARALYAQRAQRRRIRESQHEDHVGEEESP